MYTNIFRCKTLQNLPKLRFLVFWKYAIWSGFVIGSPLEAHRTYRQGDSGKGLIIFTVIFLNCTQWQWILHIQIVLLHQRSIELAPGGGPGGNQCTSLESKSWRHQVGRWCFTMRKPTGGPWSVWSPSETGEPVQIRHVIYIKQKHCFRVLVNKIGANALFFSEYISNAY
jgi:hypothetical protein